MCKLIPFVHHKNSFIVEFLKEIYWHYCYSIFLLMTTLSAPNAHFIIYADDTTVYSQSSNISQLYSEMYSTLSKITNWAKLNKLSINLNKTQFMIFNKKNPNFTDIIKLDDISIDLVSSFKLLGIIIDDNLNYKNHVEYILSIN